MENKEKFTRDILHHTKDGTISWEKAMVSTAPPYIKKILSSHATGYVARSGEENIFSYYIIKVASKDSSDYIFYVYCKNTFSFSLQAEEMVEPFTLKALYDAISYTDNEKRDEEHNDTPMRSTSPLIVPREHSIANTSSSKEVPTVFISYSHDSEEHKAWVAQLATDLMGHGVNVLLDQWDLRLGSDLRFFMENGLSAASLVLCICSEAYVEKVNSGRGGSGYEGMIMSQALLQNANSDYVIAVVRNNPSSKKVPLAFASKLYTDFSDDKQYLGKYSELLEQIHGERDKKKPCLGENPYTEKLARKIEIKTLIESSRYHSAAMFGTVTFRYDNHNGIYTIGSGEYAFDTKWTNCGNNAIYAYNDCANITFIGVNYEITEYPSAEEIQTYDYSSRYRKIKTGQIVLFVNTHGHIAAVRVGKVKSSSHGHLYDEMTFEYRIYEKL